MAEEIKVFSHEVNIAGILDFVDVTLPWTVDQEHAFVFVKNTIPGCGMAPTGGTAGGTSFRNLWAFATFIDNDTVRIDRSNNLVQDMTVAIEVWFYDGAPGGPNEFTVIDVQKLHMTSGATNVTVNLEDTGVWSGPISNIVGFFAGIDGTTGVGISSGLDRVIRCTVETLNYLSINFLRIWRSTADTDEFTAYVPLVNFNGANWKIHTKYAAPAVQQVSAGGYETYNLGSDVNGGSWDHAFIVYTRRSFSFAQDYSSILVFPGSTPSEVRIHSKDVVNSGNRVGFYVISNAEIYVEHRDTVTGGQPLIPDGSIGGAPQTEVLDRTGDAAVAALSEHNASILNVVRDLSAFNTGEANWTVTDSAFDEVTIKRARIGDSGFRYHQQNINFNPPINVEVDSDIDVERDDLYLNPDNLYVLLRDSSDLSVDPSVDMSQVAYSPDFQVFRGTVLLTPGTPSVAVDLTTEFPEFIPGDINRYGIRIQNTRYGGVAPSPSGVDVDTLPIDHRVWVTKDSDTQITFNINALATQDVTASYEIVQYMGPTGGPNEIRFRGQAVGTFLAGETQLLELYIQIGVEEPVVGSDSHTRFVAMPNGIDSDSLLAQGSDDDKMLHRAWSIFGLFGPAYTSIVARTTDATIYSDTWDFIGDSWRLGVTEPPVAPPGGLKDLVDPVSLTPADIVDWDHAAIVRTTSNGLSDFNPAGFGDNAGSDSDKVALNMQGFIDNTEAAVVHHPEMAVFRGITTLDFNDITGSDTYDLAIGGTVNPDTTLVNITARMNASSDSGNRDSTIQLNYSLLDENTIRIETGSLRTGPNEVDVSWEVFSLPGWSFKTEANVDVTGSVDLAALALLDVDGSVTALGSVNMAALQHLSVTGSVDVDGNVPLSVLAILGLVGDVDVSGSTSLTSLAPLSISGAVDVDGNVNQATLIAVGVDGSVTVIGSLDLDAILIGPGAEFFSQLLAQRSVLSEQDAQRVIDAVIEAQRSTTDAQDAQASNTDTQSGQRGTADVLPGGRMRQT